MSNKVEWIVALLQEIKYFILIHFSNGFGKSTKKRY